MDGKAKPKKNKEESSVFRGESYRHEVADFPEAVVDGDHKTPKTLFHGVQDIGEDTPFDYSSLPVASGDQTWNSISNHFEDPSASDPDSEGFEINNLDESDSEDSSAFKSFQSMEQNGDRARQSFLHQGEVLQRKRKGRTR